MHNCRTAAPPYGSFFISILLAHPHFSVVVGVQAGGIRIIRLGGIMVF
jgi:hypothetical protein